MPRLVDGAFREALVVYMLLREGELAEEKLVEYLGLPRASVRKELRMMRSAGVIVSVPRSSSRKLDPSKTVRLTDPLRSREWYEGISPILDLEVVMHSADVAQERLEASEWRLTQALAETTLSPQEVAKRVKSIHTPREAEKRIQKAKQEVQEREEASGAK